MTTDDWPPPWRRLEGSFQGRLDHELQEGHVLWGQGARAIGHNESTDDVVVLLPDGRGAIVHLTWSEERGDPRFPATELHPSAEALTAALWTWSEWAGFLDED
jgi:hypothetical protein